MVRKRRRENPEKVQAEDRAKYYRNHERYKKYRREYIARKRSTPEGRMKIKANSAVTNAVRDKRLTKPEECSVCYRTDKRIEAHHDDYSKPLEVRWLCSQCHRRQDAGI